MQGGTLIGFLNLGLGQLAALGLGQLAAVVTIGDVYCYEDRAYFDPPPYLEGFNAYSICLRQKRMHAEDEMNGQIKPTRYSSTNSNCKPYFIA